MPGVYREAVAKGVRSTVLRPFLAVQRGTVEREARFDDPDRLRAERDSLAALMVGQASLAAENRQLRSLLGLDEKLPVSFVPAEVVRTPGRGAEGFFQLTAGRAQGVEPGAPIVGPDGLVGRVRDVDDEVSFGIDWMNPEFRASAMTLDGSVYGIAEPRRGPNGEPMLALTGTPRHVQLEVGTMIVTSGVGGVFPRGIPIGVVSEAEGRETSWQRNYLIEPLVGPGEMNYVLVLGAPQATLSGQDLALSWGIQEVPEVSIDTASQAAPAVPGATAAPAAPGRAPAAEPAEGPPETAPPATRPPARPPLLGSPVPPADTLGAGAERDG